MRPWLANYSHQVPKTVDVTPYQSVVDLLDSVLADHASRTAYKNFGVELSYSSLHQLSYCFASYLKNNLGLKAGDRVAIMMPNLLQYPIAMYGILRAGLIVVNVNPLYTSSEVAHQLNDAGVSAIVVATNFAATVQKALPGVPSLQHIMTTDLGDMLGSVKGAVINFVVKHIKKMVPAYDLPHEISFREALKIGAKKPLGDVSYHLDNIAFLQYTGGTTGKPKGAMLTHRNMVANVLQSKVWIDFKFDCHDVVLTALPMYHIYSLTVCCLVFNTLGATSLLITNPRDLDVFVKTLSKNKVTMFVGINTLFRGLLRHPKFATLDFSALRVTASGGMVLQPSTSDEWQRVTGMHITDGYGLTEASPVVAMNPIDSTHFTGCIGMPVPSTNVVIKDNNGNIVPIGGIGEICLRGPQVMKGYWHEPEETALVLDEDGWLETGDIGCMDENGYITLLDRKKDMVLVSGFNVYPSEVEAVLVRHPSITEAAVVSVPDDKTGEAVKAFIVSQNAAISSQEVMDFCKEHLTRYKIPKQIAFCDALPKSTVGKVLRNELRNKH